MKKNLLLVLLVLILLTGCRRGVEATLEATPSPEPKPLGVTYCNIAASDLCLEGFGLDSDGRLLILLRADDRFFADIYILANGPEGEIFFECQQSEHFLENVYCQGEPFEEGELIKLNIHSQGNDQLVALGVFTVQYGDLPAPDVAFAADATPRPVPTPVSTPVSTQAPSYPNSSYPNSDYPNP